MRLLGVIINLVGFVIAIAGLLVTTSNVGRLIFALGGIGVSLFAIFGLLNSYYLKNAIWKR